MENKRIIEINGVKLEVDLRYAKTIEAYRIGQKVKVLIKEYTDSYKSYPGVIVGFDNFVERPTIVIAYVQVTGYDSNIKIVYLNKDSKDIEITPMIVDEVAFTREDGLKLFQAQIDKKKGEVEELEMKKSYFLEKFGEYFKA